MSNLRRRGTTLIELLFGLVILATLLAAVVTARGRFLRTAADAQRKEKLVAALDAQLTQWFAAPSPTVPINATGPLDALRGATWTTRTQPSPSAASLGCAAVQVEAGDDRTPPLHVAVNILVRHSEPVTP